MMKDQLREAIHDALRLLVRYDSELIKTQPKEECLNHRLAKHLESVLRKKKLLGSRSVDIEYNLYGCGVSRSPKTGRGAKI